MTLVDMIVWRWTVDIDTYTDINREFTQEDHSPDRMILF